MYTGVDDGEREKTMDLQLKEDRKKGAFGDAEVGGGTDERFKLKGGVHAFNSNSRLSVLGNANNLNEYGFSWGDYIDMLNGNSNGGARRGISYISFNSNSPVPMSWSAPNNGVFTSRSGGLNFNHDPNKKHRLNLTYFYTELHHNLIQNTQGDEFNTERLISVEEDEFSDEQQRSHSGMLTYRWDPDSLNRFELMGSLSLREQQGSNEFNSIYQTQGDTTLQTGDRETRHKNENLQYLVDLDYTHRFNKDKRYLSISGNGERSESDIEDFYQSLNTFPLANRHEFIDQMRMNMGSTENYAFDASYTEPLSKNHLLSLKLNHANNQLDAKTDVFDGEGGGFRPALSPWYRLERSRYSASLEYQYLLDNEGSQISTTLPVDYIRQVATDFRNDQRIDPDPWIYFLPGISWRKESKEFGRITISLERDLSLPQLPQWIANRDSTNPLSVRLGNPDLQPGLENNLSLSYYNYNNFNQTSRYLRIWGGIDQNPIVNSQFIDDDFTRVIQPVNTLEPRYNLNASGSYRFPITAWKIFINPKLRYSYSQVNEPLNAMQNRHRNQTLSPSLGISNFRSNKLTVYASGDWDFSWANYSRQAELNNYFVAQNYRLKLTYTPNKRLSLRSDLNYRIYSQERFAEAIAIPLFNASISYSFLSDRTLTLKLTVFDILGQNTGIERMVQGNNIYQVQANNLTRYGLLSLIWRFKKQ
ncbi:MAG: outer membrane beta-barrel protein [Owenweeksia sp.]|nr:outer membrane beta-barrel protein [Owenweeksia sp.]